MERAKCETLGKIWFEKCEMGVKSSYSPHPQTSGVDIDPALVAFSPFLLSLALCFGREKLSGVLRPE